MSSPSFNILPYYLAVEPAPTDDRCVFAVVRSVGHGGGVAVSVVLESESGCDEVFQFEKLDFTKIAWSADGRLLAFAQNFTLMVRKEDGGLQLDALEDYVGWIGFDSKHRLWCLTAGRLECRANNKATITIENVVCATASANISFCRFKGTDLYIYSHDGIRERVIGCISEVELDTLVDISQNGGFLTLVIRSIVSEDRARVRIVRLDSMKSRTDLLLDEYFAFGFNGGPGIETATLNSGEVLACYENGPCTQVWSLKVGCLPEAISSDDFEVFDFAVNATADRLAIIASDTQSAEGGFERQLLIGHIDQVGWRFSSPIRGVYGMPRWRHDGRLEVLHSEGTGWTKLIRGFEEPDDAVYSNEFKVITVKNDLTSYDVMKLPGSERRRSGIILLPRIHQQFVAGAQGFFFHHLVFWVALSLAADGYQVFVLNGPGAIGRGQQRREFRGSYFKNLQLAVDDLADSLRQKGYDTLGILAGSLAAVPALRLIGAGTKFSAAAFIAPLFEASIPVTKPVERHLYSDPLVMSLGDAIASVEKPILIVYGACEEVVPVSQITDVCDGVRNEDDIELCVFPEEGHIFKTKLAWQTTESAIHEFFRLHLT